MVSSSHIWNSPRLQALQFPQLVSSVQIYAERGDDCSLSTVPSPTDPVTDLPLRLGVWNGHNLTDSFMAGHDWELVAERGVLNRLV